MIYLLLKFMVTLSWKILPFSPGFTALKVLNIGCYGYKESYIAVTSLSVSEFTSAGDKLLSLGHQQHKKLFSIPSEDRVPLLFCALRYAVCLFAGPLCPVHQVRKQILQFTLQRRNRSQQCSRDLLQSLCRLFLVISFPSVFKSMGVLSGWVHTQFYGEHPHMHTHGCMYSVSGPSFNFMTCCLY